MQERKPLNLKVGAVVMIHESEDSAEVAMIATVPLPLSHQAIRAMAAALNATADLKQKEQEAADRMARLIRPS